MKAVEATAQLLLQAKRPMIYAGGGAVNATTALTAVAEKLGAAVITTNAGKGVIPDSHPLALGGAIVRPETRDFMASADVLLAIGTEMSETDGIVEKLDIPGQLIRIDIR